MKFSAVLVCLASQALASGSSPLAERDFDTVSDVLQHVQSDIQGLDSAVKAGGTDPEPLLKASNALIQTLKDSKTKVDGSSDLALTDAVKLTQPVQDMTKVSQDLVDDLSKVKSTIEKLGYCDAVRMQTSKINDGSQALIKAVVGKVPQEAQDIASQLSAGLVKILKQAQDDFSEQNCKGSSAGAAKQPAGGDHQATGGAAPQTPATHASTSAPASANPETPTAVAEASHACMCSSPAPTPTGMGTGTGAMTARPSSTNPVPVTAGAALFAPAGAVAFAFAALAI
ncbi:hypothetical protein E4U42_002441 [Claviceps africana]|uniref:Cell wall protein n=1 Tax=Claviceps africana TaxID=83212 RepID=A0A8K0NIK7_9HYPO|nr:hypothetical protein E4U42_002441 [Claviceps africana]